MTGKQMMTMKQKVGGVAAFAAALLLGLMAALAQAQEGHPLHGSWSGERMVDGKASRVLLVIELQRDQALTGYVLESGKRSALQDVELHTADWSVTFALDGGYRVRGSIGELGSQTARTITGSWTDSAGSGDFHVELN